MQLKWPLGYHLGQSSLVIVLRSLHRRFCRAINSCSMIFAKFWPIRNPKSVVFRQVDFYSDSIPSTTVSKSNVIVSVEWQAQQYTLLGQGQAGFAFQSKPPTTTTTTTTCPVPVSNPRWALSHQAFSIEHYQGGSPTINDQSIWTATICRGGIDFPPCHYKAVSQHYEGSQLV